MVILFSLTSLLPHQLVVYLKRKFIFTLLINNVLGTWPQTIMCPEECSEYQQAMKTAREALGEKDFAESWEEGHRMTVEQVRQFVERLPIQ